MLKFVAILMTLLMLSSCSYTVVYYKTMDEVTETFDPRTVNVKRVRDQHSDYYGYYRVKYESF